MKIMKRKIQTNANYAHLSYRERERLFKIQIVHYAS